MKIGIMTWWRNTNYGGFLQGLALQTFLRKNGYDVEMIPFASWGGRFLPYTAIWPQRIKSLRQFVGAVVNAFLALFIDGKPFARMNRLRKTQALIDEYIKTSPREFATLSELNQYGHYDTLIAGSDQVWSPRWHDKDFSYLLGGIDDKVRKISYAASCGAFTVHPYEEIYGKALSRFYALSVREKTNVPELEKLSGKKVEWVVDPTLLLSADEWRELLKLKTTPDEPHITFYGLSFFENRLPELVRLAKEKKVKIHIFTNVDFFKVNRNPLIWARHLLARLHIALSPHLSLRIGADAREWVQDIATAEFVLSDSFHALMFATIFGREIRVEFTDMFKVAMSARITDFQTRASELDSWREWSMKWLLNAIG